MGVCEEREKPVVDEINRVYYMKREINEYQHFCERVFDVVHTKTIARSEKHYNQSNCKERTHIGLFVIVLKDWDDNALGIFQESGALCAINDNGKNFAGVIGIVNVASDLKRTNKRIRRLGNRNFHTNIVV